MTASLINLINSIIITYVKMLLHKKSGSRNNDCAMLFLLYLTVDCGLEMALIFRFNELVPQPMIVPECVLICA